MNDDTDSVPPRGPGPRSVRSPVPPVPPSLPEALPYDIVGVVGQGSSAVVYRAVHMTHGGAVALKVRRSGLDARARARFRRECELQWQLSDHPNVVRLLDASTPNAAQPWTLMPLCDFSLDAVADGHETADPSMIRAWAVDVLRGLAAVHEAGLLHRDVKPSNVLVKNGVAALSDFGCAHGGADPPTDLGAGTPGYLAPELHTGSDPSTRSDVYSAAITLRRLLGPTVPDTTDNLLTRASSQDPHDRPADGGAFLADYLRATAPDQHAPAAPRHATMSTPPTSPPRPDRGRHRAPATGALIGAGLLGGVLLTTLVLGPGQAIGDSLLTPTTALTTSQAQPTADTAPTTDAPPALPQLARLPAAAQADLRSVDGGSPTFIRFENRGDVLIRIIWLDRDGNRQFFCLLHPGEARKQATWVGHPWLVADGRGNDLFVVQPTQAEGLVTVT